MRRLETTDDPPVGFPIEDLPERPEEFAPGLTPELMELVVAASTMNGGSMAANSMGTRPTSPRSRSSKRRL